MTLERYLKLRESGLTLEKIQAKHYLSEGTVWTLELGYQCFLKNIRLDDAIKLIQDQP